MCLSASGLSPGSSVEDRTDSLPTLRCTDCTGTGIVGSGVLLLLNYCLICWTISDLDSCQNVKKAVSLIETVEEELVNKQVCNIDIRIRRELIKACL